MKHGHHGTRTYRIWCNMKARCQRKTHPRYEDWGGRGIKVCDRWQAFACFLADMGEASPDMSIERQNNDGPYEPDNCIWATAEQQGRNKRPQRTTRRIPRSGTASGGLLGAIYEKSRNKWRAVIMLDGKQRLLGRFDTAEEAHQAYVVAAEASGCIWNAAAVLAIRETHP